MSVTTGTEGEQPKIIDSRYEVLRILGSGGMGEVLLVRDLALEGEELALKKLWDSIASNAKQLARFRNEVLIARRLSHPNIVRIYDFGHSQSGDYYITMEYVEGRSLVDRIYAENEPQLSLYEIISILLPLTSALHHAHTKKVVHRDLKPDNVLLSVDGTVKITDFGIARSLEQDKGLTAFNEVVGTSYYMSPEQFRGSGVDGRSDIYSLGILAFEMAARRRPFEGEQANNIATKHYMDNLPKVAQYAPGFPGWFQDFLETCCEKEPEHRFQSMLEVAEVLMEFRPKGESLPSAFDMMLPVKLSESGGGWLAGLFGRWK